MGLLTHGHPVKDLARQMVDELNLVPELERIDLLNKIRELLHEASPFRDEPVDFVKWVPCEDVRANDYNPNKVAPPEMRLLATSILADGYTQPVVTNQESSGWTVVDGFHRNRIAKEHKEVKKRIKGYLPIVQIRRQQVGREERMASTVRHNRARGRHGVDEMSSLVAELAKKAWTDEKIAAELGMDQDEVLRLKQITGLAELFSDKNFSAAWEIDEDALAGELLG